MRQIALDTETTGMNKIRGNNGALVAVGHRIIEIACVEILDGVITGSTFHTYINPQRKIDKQATAVHGITDDMVKNAPKFKDIATALLEFIGDSNIIIHNAPFDLAFLDKEFNMLPKKKQPTNKYTVIDTLKIARWLFPGQHNTLEGLCHRFNIANKVEHSALLDAVMLAHLYLKLTAI